MWNRVLPRHEIPREELIQQLHAYIGYAPSQFPFDSWTRHTRTIRNLFWTHIHEVLTSHSARQNEMFKIIKNFLNITRPPRDGLYSWAGIPHNFIIWRFAVCLAMMHAYCMDDLNWVHQHWNVSPFIQCMWPDIKLQLLSSIIMGQRNLTDMHRIVFQTERLLAPYLMRVLQSRNPMADSLRPIDADPRDTDTFFGTLH